MKTKVGQIAKLILSSESPETPLQKKLGEVGKKLGLAALFICLLIFVIGILKKIPVIQMFMTSVGLAVAAIPEGLPAIVTIMLSIGITKMSKKNSIIRKLPAVETLGCSQVICSDKTGTLTQNKMKVIQITDTREVIDTNTSKNNKFILELGVLCNNSDIVQENGQYVAIGTPTEAAIVNAGIKNNIKKEELYRTTPRIDEIPFDSSRKLMTTINKFGIGYRIITKGAPDVLIKKCNRYYENGEVHTINEYKINQITKVNLSMADKALRVIAVAYSDVNNINKNHIEENLIFVRFNWNDRSTKRRCKRSSGNL